MGNTGSIGMAEAVEDGLASLDQALIWQLESNHFPPVSARFVPAAKEAIEHASEGDWDHEIDLPNGLRRTTSEIVEGLHLEAFVDWQEDL